MYIHENQYEPRIAEGIDISTGFKTNLVVSKQVMTQLGPPFSDCKTKDELKQLNASTTFNATFLNYAMKSSLYRQTACLDSCFRHSIPPREPKDPNNLNDTNNNKDPFNGHKDPMNDKGLNLPTKSDNYKACLPYCPQECELLTYTVSISFTDFPSESYGKFLLKNPRLQDKLYQSEYYIRSNFYYLT